MKTILILLLLSIPACNQATGATDVQWKPESVASDTPVAQSAQHTEAYPRIVDSPAPKPGELPAPSVAEALPLESPPDAGIPQGKLLSNGCHEGYRDLGACCAPDLDPGDCNCKTHDLCARSCKYVDGVANVDVYCVDGGV